MNRSDVLPTAKLSATAPLLPSLFATPVATASVRTLEVTGSSALCTNAIEWIACSVCLRGRHAQDAARVCEASYDFGGLFALQRLASFTYAQIGV